MATGVAFEDLQEVIAETNPPSLVSSSTATISSLAKECVKRYDALCTTLRETTSETATAHGFVRDDVFIRIQDARPRFKAWATNIAALQEGHLKSSLDFRLREAVEIRSRVLKILESLKESLNEAELIVTGVRGNKTWEVGAMSDSSFNSDFGSEFSSEESDTGSVNERLETSELDELLSAIKMANSSLMDISIVIRNTPTRDDYAKAAARYSLDSHWDISHVDAKFGSAKRSSDWLIQRLGKSITRRRQYLTYRKNHHDKLSKDWDEPPKEVVVLEEEEKAPQTLALTKATTYVEALPAPPKDGSEVGSFETETSYQQTVAGETEDHILTVPPPPAEAFEGVPFEFGHPFQCPYCWTEQNVKGRNAWKKHVFRDLRPYVCTFKECNLRMFRSRNEWFAHELQAHRREWTCATCSKLFSSKSSFKSHLVWHNPAVAGSELDALILQSEEPMDRFPASACSFCDEWEDQIMNPNQNEKRAFLNDGKDVAPYGTKTQFRRHLGRHMEQLALFALPRDNLDDVEDDSDREIRGEVIGDDSDASTGTTASMYVGEATSTEEYFHDEINRIRKELPGVKIEASEMGAGGRTYYASLVGPWGANDTTVPIEVTVVFAERDLDFNVPKFGLHSAHILTDDYLLLKNQVCEIADSFAARPRDCVKGVLTYLLGEAEFVNGSLISKKDILASNDDPSAKDFADHWIGPETLEEEISHFQKARPEVTFDKIDLVQRNVTITLLNVCLEIDFPEAYPKSETPTFTVSVPASSSRSLPDDASTIIIRAMIEIAEMCLARHRGCFENVFTYILSVMGGADPNNRIILKEEGKASIGSVPGETSGASGDDEQSLTSVQASEDSNAIEVQVGPEFWQEEVSHVRTRLPQIDLDVDLMTNSVCAVLDEPRDDDGIAHHIELYIYFPSGYPISKAPAFTFGSIWGFHLETGELGREMTNIAEACLARKQGCLEAVLTYLGVKMDPPLRNPKEQVDIESDSEILDKIETGLAPESETYLKCCQCGEPVPPSAYMEKNCSSCAHRCCVRCIRKVETATDAHPEGTSSDLQEESLAGDEDLISAAHQAGKDDTMTERSDMDHFDQDSELNIIEQHHKIGMPSKGITSENTTTIRIIFYTAPLTGHDLLTLFRPYGQILGVRVPDKARFAYMKFVHREDAERAIKEMDKYLVNGHSLDVDFAATSWTEKLEESDDSDPIPGDATALANPLSPELQTTVDRVIEGREMSDEDWAKWVQDLSRKNIPITSKQPTAETSDQLPGDQSSKETPVVPIVQKRYVQVLTVDTPEDAILDPEASMQAMEEDDMAPYAGEWRAENAPSGADLGTEPLVPDTQIDIADKEPSPPLMDQMTVNDMPKMQMEYYFSELEARAENQSSAAVDVVQTLAQSQSNAQRNSETNVKDPVAWAARLEEYKEIFRDSLRKEESLAVESYEALLKSIGLVLDVSHQERMYRRIADDRVAAVNKYEAVSQSALASAAAAPDRMNWEETLEIAMKSQVLRFRTSQARFRVQTVGAYEVSGVVDDARTESRASVTELGQDLPDDTTQSQPPAEISRDGVAYNPEELVLPVETILDQSEEDIKILEKAIDKEIRASMTRHRSMLLQGELLGFEQMGENWTRKVEELKGDAIETYRSLHTSYRDSESNTVTSRNRRRDAVLRNFVSTLKLEEATLGLALCGFRDDSMRAAAKSEVEDEEEEVEEKEEEEEGDLYEEQQQRINPIGDIDKPAGSLSRDFAEANEVPGIKESGLELLRGDRLAEENNERHLRHPELQTAGNNPALGQVTAQTTSESHGNIENADPEEYDPEKYVDQRLRKLREIYKKLEFYRQLSDPAQQAEFLGQQEPAVAREMKDKIELARQLDLERHASLRGPTVNIEKSEADDNLESDNQEKISPAHSLSSLRTVPEGAGVDWQAGGETLSSSTSVEAERQVVESRETGMRETGTVVPIGEDDMEVYRLRDRSLHGKEADQDGEEQSVEYAQAGSSNKRRAALPPGSDHGSTHDINMSRTKAGDGVDISNSDEPRTSSYSSIKNTLDWESIKEPFFKLYVQEDRPLQEVQAILKETHGFNASERMFKAHIRYWNFDRGKVIREMARSLEAQQVLPSVANNYNFQPAPRSLAEVIEKQPSDQRSEDIASPAAERNPQTSTTEAEDITAWKIRLEADRTYWFEAFDVEIDIAREAMMRDGILGSKRDGFALTRLQAWQKAADELRTKAHKTYSAAHDSALEAGRESTLTDADKRGWQARLWDVADRVQMLSLKDGLTALAAEVAELKSKEDGAEEMENEATQESQTRAESTEGKGLALTNESSNNRSVGSSSPLEPSESQFLKESPWANPQHPSHQILPDGQTLANQHQRTPRPVPQVMVQPQQGQHRQGLSPPTAGLKEVRQDIPPCNTLTVGNLPRDASEDELKAIFTRQRGYKRMLFRTKEAGLMCYVEFDDIPSATEALHNLHGHLLHNSIHGGIKLGYSRNQLGRRSDVASADATERWMETAETSRVPARFEAGRASSDFISLEEFDRAASEDVEHVTKTAADLIKSAAI